jgi:hypothetical protein
MMLFVCFVRVDTPIASVLRLQTLCGWDLIKPQNPVGKQEEYHLRLAVETTSLR